MPTKYIAFGRAPTPPETLERRLRIHSTAENNPVIPRMADMISNLNRGHTIASIIQQQLNKRSLQPLSVIFANFDALQDIVTNGVNFYEKVQATFHQCEERCKVLEKQGEEFRQLVNTREIVYIAHVASLKVSMRNLDQENHQGEIERLKYDIDNAKGEIGAADNNERSLQRYALLRQASEASKKLNKICYEWENFEKNEAKWRLDYAVTVEGSHKCYEEMGRLREKLGTLHAHGLALLERVQPLRKCTCGEDCAVENYEHRYGRKDEWKMGIEGL